MLLAGLALPQSGCAVAVLPFGRLKKQIYHNKKNYYYLSNKSTFLLSFRYLICVFQLFLKLTPNHGAV